MGSRGPIDAAIQSALGDPLRGGGRHQLARISHQDPGFWGKLAKQVGRSLAEP